VGAGKALHFTQQDITDRAGMVRQQYQRLECGGAPRLDTLELAADGLNARLMLIPLKKLYAVQALLREGPKRAERLDEDPWQGLLGDEECGENGRDGK
jgi:HTH-type transcriptional regulator/antitoxin HipB